MRRIQKCKDDLVDCLVFSKVCLVIGAEEEEEEEEEVDCFVPAWRRAPGSGKGLRIEGLGFSTGMAQCAGLV